MVTVDLAGKGIFTFFHAFPHNMLYYALHICAFLYISTSLTLFSLNPYAIFTAALKYWIYRYLLCLGTRWYSIAFFLMYIEYIRRLNCFLFLLYLYATSSFNIFLVWKYKKERYIFNICIKKTKKQNFVHRIASHVTYFFMLKCRRVGFTYMQNNKKKKIERKEMTVITRSE